MVSNRRNIATHLRLPIVTFIASSIHAGPAGYITGAEALSPQYEGESWSAKNARLLALRKERSRDAARSRRGKENYEFYELAKLLPLPAAITSQLDKASIIRLSISYLRMRDFCLQGDPPWHPSFYGGNASSSRRPSHAEQGLSPTNDVHTVAKDIYENNLGTHILQAFDGFLFTLCSDGRFLYISETVSIYLGLSQVELTGSSMFDFVHPGDHMELAEKLGMQLPTSASQSSDAGKKEGPDSRASSPGMPSPPATPQENLSMSVGSNTEALEKSFLIRMKSTLTKRGVNFKSSGYKVIHITGSLRPRYLPNYESHAPEIMGFVGIAFALPPPTFNELRLEPSSFVCKVSMDLKITYCEDTISSFLDYNNEEIVDRNLYDFLHAQDVRSMRSCHLDMLTKGQSISHYFRWMCKSGGYVWMQATILLLLSKNTSDTAFIFIFQVISCVEHASIAMSINQMSCHLETSKTEALSSPSPEPPESRDEEKEKEKLTSEDKEIVASEGSESSEGSRASKRPVQDLDHRRYKRKKLRSASQDKHNGHSLESETGSQGNSNKVPDDVTEFGVERHSDEHSTSTKLKLITNSKKPSKLQTFDYQNNNIHSPDATLKVQGASTGTDGSSEGSCRDIHAPDQQSQSLPSSPKSGTLSEKNHSHSPNSNSPVRQVPLSRHQNLLYPPNMDISKVKDDQSLTIAMAPESSPVFHFPSPGRLPSVHPDSREELLYGPTPFMINSTPAQYSTMAFPNFAKFSSIQQYGNPSKITGRPYHGSSHSGPLLLKGYQNSHDLPMDLSYSTHPSLAGYTPVPIMHTGLTSSSPSSYSGNVYSPGTSHRLPFSNEELMERVSLERGVIPHTAKS